MKRYWVLIAAVIAVFVLPASSADDDLPVGRLHRIDLKSQHPKAYHPSIGDMVQCYLDFPIVPEQIVDGLRVDVSGSSASCLGVVSTSLPKIIGSGQISAYFLPRALGPTKVTIRPAIPGRRSLPTYTLTLHVMKPRER